MTTDRSKHPSSYRLSPRTKGQLEELARQWGMNRSEVLALLIDRAHREDRRDTVSETIPVEFDPAVLPIWAQREPVVVAAARKNLDFRATLCERGNDPLWHKSLCHDARTIMRVDEP